jgi:hypothetical protein
MTTDERIEKLEKGLASARRLNRWLLAAVATLAVAVAGMGLAMVFCAFGISPARDCMTVKEVRADRFVVVDENGKERAVLGSGGKWGPSLSLLDENGECRASLNLLGGVPSLTVSDSLRGVTLYVGQDEVGLTLVDHQKRTDRAQLTLGNAGPALTLADENGKARAVMAVIKDGPALTLYDEKGRCRATVGVAHTETLEGKTIAWTESSLFLWDVNGKPLWHAP